MPRKSSKVTTEKSNKDTDRNYLQNIETDLRSNQSKLSLVLGALIVLVVGILIFNFFNKGKSDLGPAQQTEQQTKEDVSPDELPGKYTVKEGDTLFAIADKYYQDGYKYEEIAKTNNISNADDIEVGKTLEIPKLAESMTTKTPATTPTPSAEENTPPPSVSSDFGPVITSGTYTVAADDWLSKIAARAYGDVMLFDKIAKANNIQNPDLIEPGTILTIPR